MLLPREPPASSPGESRKLGRPPDPRAMYRVAAEYAARFGVSRRVVEHTGVVRLEACADDTARRLLLGAKSGGTH